EQYIVDHLEIFIVQNTEISPEAERVAFLPFDVNVLVDNTGVTEAPVVIERSPNYSNLFGTIERIPDGRGEATIDFTCIRAGSLHRAAGGYLILNLNDLFEEPNVWVTLKRSLKNESHEIRGFDSVLLLPVTTIKPEAIDLDVKVILIGDAWSYQVLYEYDEDFEAIFKVKAEFDSEMPNHRRNLSRYAHFIKNLCTSEGLLAFHKTGVATVIEEGVRMAGRQSKLTTKFSDISDVVREANYWARRESARVVRGKHVRKAIDERTRRVALYEDKMQEAFDDGTLLLDTRESGVGQVNGLAVYDTGDHAFGKPNRITAETGVGRAGVINIEREAEMSGRLHTKGMLILEGYLRRMYAQDKPITMTASICFEQAYSGIDGDSASSTEIYALLSSIAGAPLRQDLAVTGSVNQKGEIQPIGGVNEKIEGFFDVCRNKGLTGTQGVMIPALNKRDLMLRAEVVEAVRKGKFHIYAIDTIDNGIEILTGLKAGRRLKNGGYTKGSMHDLVDASLHRFHKSLRHSENGAEDGKRKD
ncbi:MAG: Lon protease family protein, partial [Candidatus Krumholzibacteriota bacterium]|nr:Lon protease family protein [Candidatus Krumholzibacteriota bacterium]